MTTPRTRRIRRVLVALDVSPGSLAAAGAAARLARALEAELVGLFVEDPALLKLGESPHARQMALHGVQAHPVTRVEIERQLRAQAARARRALSQVAAREGVVCSFRVSRGAVVAELLAESRDEDLLTVGRIGWSHGPSRRLGSTARALLDRRPGRVLLLERDARVAPPPGVVFDGSDKAVEALFLAVPLARPVAGGLVVLATGAEARRQAARGLEGTGLRCRFEEVDASSASLAAAITELGIGLLVLPIGGNGYTDEDLADLLARLRIPFLVVR